MTIQEIEAKMQADRMRDCNPRAVACYRGKNNYDAEIVFCGKQYLLKCGYARHEDAMAAAQAVCDSLVHQFQTIFKRMDFKFAKE